MAQEGGDLGAEGYERISIPFSYDPPVSVPTNGNDAVCMTSNLAKQNRTVGVFLQKGISKHCMQMMQDVRHPNVLRMEAVVYNSEDILASTVLLQQYHGSLESYIDGLLLIDASFEEIVSVLRLIFKQIVEALQFLMDLDLYHGSFSLDKTYYIIEDDVPVVKLANFISWDACEYQWTKKDAWSSDWFMVGKGLDKIVLLIDETTSFPNSLTKEITELAAILKNMDNDPLKMKNLALQQPFFWGPGKRASVFTFDVPMWMLDTRFRNKVSTSFKCPSVVWNLDGYYGLLNAMNAYRQKNNLPSYAGTNKVHYLKFVSGCYTHEDELDPLFNNMTVDEVFRAKHPELCVNLMKIVEALHLHLLD